MKHHSTYSCLILTALWLIILAVPARAAPGDAPALDSTAADAAVPAGTAQPAMMPLHVLDKPQETGTHIVIHAPAIPAGPAPLPSADQMPVAPISTFIPVLPMDAPDDATPQLVPAASNHVLDGDHHGITRAIIVIHDVSRDAAAAFTIVAGMAGAANSSTLIIAPQFLTETDIMRAGDRLPDKGVMFARWPMDAWWDGGDSTAQPGQKPVSSFTVADLLLLYLSDKNSFPDMRDIVIAGFGAGGDYAGRYAAAGQAVDIVEQQNIQTHFIVAAPASYLYFTAMRPGGPKQGLVSPNTAQCPAYNAYPYGLENLNSYTRHVGIANIKMRPLTRRILYLSGGAKPVFDPFPDNSCAAMAEGENRPARAAAYETYLTIAFGDTIRHMQTFVTEPKAGYDAMQLFGSSCGMSALFAGGECAPLLVRDQDNR